MGSLSVRIGFPLILIGVLSWPMLLTSSSLGGDWQNHLWLLWQQSLAIASNHAPSPLLNTPGVVFYPEYLFYGGTLNAIGGALALILGHSPTTAYVLIYMVGYLTAYGGWYWMSRAAGLNRWLAHAPGLTFLTSACYLTILYGQGDWPEFLAMSMIPLMIAAGLSVLRARRPRALPFIALAASSIVFFGSHNLTMLWGSTILLITALSVVLCIPEARRVVGLRRLLRVAGVVIPAALVNAWFLLPAVAYQSHTKISQEYGVAEVELRLNSSLVTFDHLFTLSRATTTSEAPDYVLSLPTLIILWALVGLLVVLWGRRRGAWPRLMQILCVITGALIVLMTHVSLILALPKPYALLQFSYRLEGYILMGISASVLVILVIVQHGSRSLRLYRWTIAPILAISVLGAVQQVDAYPRTAPRSTTFIPGGSAETSVQRHADYSYTQLPLIYGQNLPLLQFSLSAIHDNHLSIVARVRPGQLVYTNIGGGPDLLHITGARIVGHDASYHLVLAVGPATATASAHPHTALAAEPITIGIAQSPPVVFGRLLSFGGALLLAFELAWLLTHRRRGTRVPEH